MVVVEQGCLLGSGSRHRYLLCRIVHRGGSADRRRYHPLLQSWFVVDGGRMGFPYARCYRYLYLCQAEKEECSGSRLTSRWSRQRNSECRRPMFMSVGSPVTRHFSAKNAIRGFAESCSSPL